MAEAPAPVPGPAPAPAPTNPAASKVRKMSWGAISSIMKKAKADAPPPPARQPRGQPPKDKNKDKKKWNGKHELVDGVWQGRWEGAEEKEESGEQPEEAARRREQQESWRETLPWLSVEKKKKCAVPGCTGCNLCALLFCTLCIERMTPPCANSTCNKFCSGGCDWFHHDAVKRHAANYHSHDMTCKSRNLPNELSKMIEDHKERLLGVILVVYTLAKKKVGLWQVTDWCLMSDLLGVPLGKKYVNHIAAHDFMMSIAYVLRRRIIDAAVASPTIALMIDESTDISHCGHMVVYLRLLWHGIYTTMFFRLVQVHDTTAEGLVATLDQVFEDDGLPKFRPVSKDWGVFAQFYARPRGGSNPIVSGRSRVASFASDGASVLTGRLHGVAVLLQQRWNMFMLVVHCIAHRYALGAEDASKDNDVAEYVEANMHSIVNYHSNSTQRREHLEKLQASLQVKVLMIIKFIETRWLCRGGVAARLHTTIGPIYYEFKADAAAKVATAKALLGVVGSFKFMLALTIFRDILTQLNLVSKAFQKAHVYYNDAREILASVKAGLTAQYLTPDFVGGEHYSELKEAAKTTSFTYNKVPGLTRNQKDERWVREGAVKYVQSIMDGLETRFPDDDKLSALCIFDFTRLPSTQEQWDASKTDFGLDEVDTLLKHFGTVQITSTRRYERFVDPATTRTEWVAFREQLFRLKLTGAKLEDGYKGLLQSPDLPNIKQLACVFLVLALSTVCCERGFSLMKLIKSRLRASMLTDTLDDLMMIASNGPAMHEKAEVQKLMLEAYDHWVSKAKRMPSRSHPGVVRPRKKKTMDSSNLHDVLRAASRMIAAEERVGGWICDSDEEMDAADTTDSPETGGDGAAAPDGEEDEPSYTAEELLEKVGPYVVPKGWKHVPVTASSPEAWREQLKKYNWKGKRLAHIFEGGWSDASYKRAEKTQPGFYVFYYKDQGDYLIHNLELSEHGHSKAWVIIEKEPTRAPRLGTATSPRVRGRNTSMTYYGRRPQIINKYFYGRA